MLNSPALKNDYLERILKARVYDVAIESPLEPRAALSKRLGNRLLLKREDLQPVFSFKLRGAYNKMARPAAARLRARRDRGERGQPRAGRGARRAAAGLQRGDRDAGHHAAHQGRRGGGARRGGRAARRLLRRGLRAGAAASSAARGLTFVHPYDDPGRDRRAGHHRHGDPAPASGPIDAIFVAGRRRRADLRHRRLREARASRRSA